MPPAATRAQIARVRRLVRRADLRREEGVVVAEGHKPIAAALDAGVTPHLLLVSEGADAGLSARWAEGSAEICSVSPADLAQVASTRTPQPELALLERSEPALTAIGGDLVVLAVAIQDPGNAGTIVRSAVAAGASGVVFCDESVDVFSPKTVRASAGAVFSVPVVMTKGPGEAMDHLRGLGHRLVATDGAATSELFACDLRPPLTIVLGNEANGLEPETIERCDLSVRIPMVVGESLNVAAAAAVVLFESVRQRRAKP